VAKSYVSVQQSTSCVQGNEQTVPHASIEGMVSAPDPGNRLDAEVSREGGSRVRAASISLGCCRRHKEGVIPAKEYDGEEFVGEHEV
jgi:hypothetical protein